VDDGSTDKTKEIVKSFKGIKLILGKHKGPGFSRNLGAKYAKGKILILVDADMRFGRDYIKKLTAPIRKGKTFGTEERFQKASNFHNNWSKCWGAHSKGYPKKVSKGNVFRAILKSKFLELGGFDPKYGYADDLTFFYKYGVRSILVDDAECYHKNPENLAEVYKQSKWIGASLWNNSKILKIPGLNLIALFALFALFPLGVIFIPLIAFYKMIKSFNFSLVLHFQIFYAVRYFGTLIGIISHIVTNKNVR